MPRLSTAISMVGERMVGCRNVALTTYLVGPKEVRRENTFDLFYFFAYDIIGSSADIIVSHFAVNYHNEAQQLGIDLNELYSALITDGEVNPPEWNTQGRQVNVYKYVVEYLYSFPVGLTSAAAADNMVMYHLLFWTFQLQEDRLEKAVVLLKQVLRYLSYTS